MDPAASARYSRTMPSLSAIKRQEQSRSPPEKRAETVWAWLLPTGFRHGNILPPEASDTAVMACSSGSSSTSPGRPPRNRS